MKAETKSNIPLLSFLLVRNGSIFYNPFSDLFSQVQRLRLKEAPDFLGLR
jgi:hypothetical protein